MDFKTVKYYGISIVEDGLYLRKFSFLTKFLSF